MKSNYSFVSKEEIQEHTYNFLLNFIEHHTYISIRVITTSIGEHFGYLRRHKDVSGNAFYRKLTRNIKVMLVFLVEQGKILRIKKSLYIVNKNDVI